MKIKTKNLTTFLSKIGMSGSQKILECVLNFGSDGVKVEATPSAAMSKVMGLLKKTAFMEYEEIGSIGINNLEELNKVIERFGEEITLKVEGNLLTVSTTGKKVEVELMSTEFITQDTRNPEMKFTDFFTFSSDKLHEIITDAQKSDDSIITIKTEAKKVQFSNTGKYKFTHEYNIPQCSGGVIVKIGQPFVDATTNLEGNIEFSVASNYPVKIVEKTETSIVTYIIAPRVDTDE